MSTSNEPLVPAIETIFHPSDFSQGSEVAFAHALKIALLTKASLNILHASPDVADVRWTDFPGVRSMLGRWGLVPEGSGKDAVSDLGIGVRKVVAPHNDPVKSALGFLEQHPTDLIVLATHREGGAMRWLRKSVAEPIARGASEMTLFIPYGMDGFVSLEDGSVSLKNILIPVDKAPRAQPAIEAARRAAVGLGLEQTTFTTVYVGEAGDAPALDLPDKEGWTWNTVIAQGNPVDGILGAANETGTDLIFMTTAGRQGFLEALSGSTTERVLHGAPCPLIAIPEGWEQIWKRRG